ncbi:MAG TPA: MarR family transcriptional regulator [Alphaproteobacteria bacterium]|nr:MarR family transcriptional regulator [Alphaproteobacteria bacterium]
MNRPRSRKAPGAKAAPTDSGYRLEAQIGFILRRAHQRHVAIFTRCMGDLKLTPMQFSALVTIATAGPISQNRLGRLTAMDPANILGVVQRLAKRGLVARGRDLRDSRSARLSLTPAGRKLVEEAIPRARAATDATLEPVAPRFRPGLLRLLGKIAE